MEKVEYKKVCKYCGSEYTSTSRNQRYCSDECCQKAQVVAKRKEKTRKRKRREYSLNQEINRGLSSAYSLAHKVADLFKVPKVCNCGAHGYTTECSGNIELNHKDGNPFNNSPDNLEYLCTRHHSVYHIEEMDPINIVDLYSRCLDESGFDDEDKRYLTMVRVYREEVNKGARVDRS